MKVHSAGYVSADSGRSKPELGNPVQGDDVGTAEAGWRLSVGSASQDVGRSTTTICALSRGDVNPARNSRTFQNLFGVHYLNDTEAVMVTEFLIVPEGGGPARPCVT